MNKLIVIISLLAFSIISCDQKKSTTETINHPENIKSDSIKPIIEKSEKNIISNPLIGNWILNGYIDSILKNRMIFKYSMSIASTAYLIKFNDHDTCKMIGYHENADLPFMDKLNSIYKFGYDTTQYWIIKLIDENRISVNEFVDSTYFKSFRADPTTYYYYKSEESAKINIHEYFTNEIFVGKYKNIDNNDIVIFSPDSKIKGFDFANEFEIIVNFGEYSPASCDVIRLSKKDNLTNEDYYHWKFISDTLLIFGMDGDYDSESGFYKAEIDKLKYKLVKD